MTKYVLLYSGGSMPETEAEQAAVMAAWGIWYDSLGAGVVDPGYPLSPMAKRIASNGHVSDVPPSDTMASGYSIIQAGSLNEAVEMAGGCPILQGGGQISVYETVEMM